MPGLIDYTVERDKFEFKEGPGFCFPCVVCRHKEKPANRQPCKTCDHNTNADPIGDEE